MMHYRQLLLGSSAMALLCGLLLTPALAQNPLDTDAQARPKAGAQSAEVPHCLCELTLSPQQQDQIKDIVRDYDADVALVWKQFADRYMESIRTEALLLAAIEDNLTEAQREQVRDQRRQTARHQKSLAGTDVKPNQAISRPANAVEEEIAILGVVLTVEQEQAADKLQEKCLGHFRSLNRDIEGLHTRLVSLEADKLAEIENVLTKDQLVQLRKIRQNTPVAPGVAASQTGPARSE